ncbi:MAG TPA: DUF2905 domain-containing protein [Gemmatimonadales bacterium]|nr:DUF2905 domain-containing protein [Gemmatimonadales bacterium]
MDERALGIGLAAIGLGLLVLGLLIWAGALGWFGRLPGDVRIERDGLRVYIPIVSMLAASVVLTTLLWLIRKLR